MITTDFFTQYPVSINFKINSFKSGWVFCNCSFFVFLSWREHMTNKSCTCHVFTPSDKYAIYLSCAHAMRVICHVCLSIYNIFRQRRFFNRFASVFFTLCFKALFLFYSLVIIVLQLHFCYFCGICVNKKYMFDLKVCCLNKFLFTWLTFLGK